MKKRLLCGLLFLLVLLTAVPLAGAESASAATMRLEKTEGSVSVLNDAGTDVKIMEKMRLFNGYTVATEEDAYAWILLDDTKACKLDEASSIRIEKDGKRLKLTLETGSVFFNITEKLASDESLEIRTGTMVTGIRGTSGWARVWSDTRTELALLDGRAQVSALNADGTTRPGSTIEIGAGKLAESNIGGQGRALLSGRISYRDVPSFVGREVADDELLQDRIDNAGAVKSADIIDNIDAKAQEETLSEHEHEHSLGAPIYVWANDHSFCTATAVCTVCGRELSERTASVLTTTAPQCETAGQNQRTAAFSTPSFAAQTFTAAIAPLGHNYTAAVTAPTCTERGFTTHTCTRCGASYTDTLVDALGHKWGEPAIRFSEDGKTASAEQACAHDRNHVLTTAAEVASKVTAEPSCVSAGTTTYTATAVVDGKTYTATKTVADIPALPHTPGEAIEENRREASCTEGGSYESAVYCTACKAELSRETVTIPALGHTPGEAVEENRREAGCTESGSYDRAVYCTVCKVELSRETAAIPALGHTPGKAVEENRREAGCTEGGSYESVVYCTVCKAELSRETVVIPALGHKYGEATYAWGDGHASCTASHTCTVCNQTEEETVKATAEVIKEATCTEPGEIKYKAVFENEMFGERTDSEVTPIAHTFGDGDDDVTYEWAEDHSSCTAKRICTVCEYEDTEVAEGENVTTETTATCTEAGERTYTARFENPDFEEQRYTEQEDATGHEYGGATYEWSEDHTSCTATRVCLVCEDEETETVEATTTTTASCEEAGTKTYTAHFMNKAFAEQSWTEEEKALGHDYGEATYVWSDDLSLCTATAVCRRDSSHTETETVSTETEDKMLYTATFKNELFKTQSNTVPAVTDPDNVDNTDPDTRSDDGTGENTDTPIVVGDDIDTPNG